MLFNSWEFVVFYVVILAAYWALRRTGPQNFLLLVASYYFYGAWDWRFCSLLVISTVVDFVAGRKIEQSGDQRVRRRWLILSVSTNLGILGIFKYCNFFAENLVALLESVGLGVHPVTLNVVLPVGISFYTFQTMSYTIDIYRGEMKATRNFLDFALFVSFFPQLVAGPVERAKTLLPQISANRALGFEQVRSGLWLVFWGFWKKIFVADNVGLIVDRIFSRSPEATAAEAYLGVLAFAAQIYCDFSGYSDIARGTSRLLGIELRRNFNLPYFAKNPSDFWRRWHMSLSTWLRDYLYISLGGNRKGEWKTYRNLVLTMGLGGLWHGASWNFVWWGLYHGALLIGHRLFRELIPAPDREVPWRRVLSQFVMLQFTLFGWLLFRSTRRVWDGVRWVDDSARQVLEMLTSYSNGLGLDDRSLHTLSAILFYTWPLILVEFLMYRTDDHYVLLQLPRPARVAGVAVLSLTWLIWGAQIGTQFIYFQF